MSAPISASTSSRPYVSTSSSSRRAPSRDAPTWASRSPYAISGMRTLRSSTRIRSRSSSPRRASLMGGMISPSPCELRALGSKVPGTPPPMSVQCALFWTKAMISPSWKTGMTTRTSLLWVPPT